VKREHWMLLLGYVVGSFFGISQLLGLFSSVSGKASHQGA